MSDDGSMRSWIMDRILEALHQADSARATASDLDDHILLSATIRLADDLETFARSFATRLTDIG